MFNIEEKIVFRIDDNQEFSTDNENILLLLPTILEDNLEKIKIFSRNSVHEFASSHRQVYRKGVISYLNDRGEEVLFEGAKQVEDAITIVKKLSSDKNVFAYDLKERRLHSVKSYQTYIVLRDDNGKLIPLSEVDNEEVLLLLPALQDYNRKKIHNYYSKIAFGYSSEETYIKFKKPLTKSMTLVNRLSNNEDIFAYNLATEELHLIDSYAEYREVIGDKFKRNK